MKDFRGNDIVVGSKVAWATYSAWRRGSIWMHTGEVLEILTETYSDFWKEDNKRELLRLKIESSMLPDRIGKETTIAAIKRVFVLPPEIPIMIPSNFGVPEEVKVDPFEMPQFTLTTGQFTFTTSQKTPFETIIDNLDQISKTERQEPIRALIKGSINLRLEDLETEEDK